MRISNEIAERLENATNEELVSLTKALLSEIQNRPQLCDYLKEMTYNVDEDTYSIDYDDETFIMHIYAFDKYLSSNMYKINENKKEKL